MSTLSKWTPTTDLKMLRRMGKLSEELGELQAVAARCIIQGIDETDPGTGRVNRFRLEDEIADVLAQCETTISAIGLSAPSIYARAGEKILQMKAWEAMFEVACPHARICEQEGECASGCTQRLGASK